MSDSKKRTSQTPFAPVQNQCREPDGPPMTSADPTKAENKYTAQLATKTATGTKGHDQMNPITPGHAELITGVEDRQQQMSRVETYGLQPRGGTLDNFVKKGGDSDPAHYPFGEGNDVRVNHPEDFPSPEEFPFVSEPRPISKEQYEYSRYLSSQTGDYQVAGNNCVDYAVDNYNQTVGQNEFEAKKEYGVVSSPRKLGEDIQNQRSLGGVPTSGRVNSNPTGAPSFGAGIVVGFGSSSAGAAVSGLVGGPMGPIVGQVAERIVNQVLSQLAASGFDFGKLFSEGGSLSADGLMDIASNGLNALAGGGAHGQFSGRTPYIVENTVAGKSDLGVELGGMIEGAAGKLVDQALGKLLAVNDQTPAGEAIVKTLASKYKDQLLDLAMDPNGTMGKLKAMIEPGPTPTSAATVPLGLAMPSGVGVVLVGGAMASARLGDMCTPIPSVPPDAGPFIQGNPTVIINGKPVAGLGHLAIGLSKGTPGTALMSAPSVLMGTTTVTNSAIYCWTKANAPGSGASDPSATSMPDGGEQAPGSDSGNGQKRPQKSDKPADGGRQQRNPSDDESGNAGGDEALETGQESADKGPSNLPSEPILEKPSVASLSAPTPEGSASKDALREFMRSTPPFNSMTGDEFNSAVREAEEALSSSLPDKAKRFNEKYGLPPAPPPSDPNLPSITASRPHPFWYRNEETGQFEYGIPSGSWRDVEGRRHQGSPWPDAEETRQTERERQLSNAIQEAMKAAEEDAEARKRVEELKRELELHRHMRESQRRTPNMPRPRFPRPPRGK